MRALFMGFALVAYAIFFATFLYLIGFVGNLPCLADHGRSRRHAGRSGDRADRPTSR